MMFSSVDDNVKQVNQLRGRRHRESSGLTIVEGYPEVRRAVKAGVPLDVVYICPEIFQDKLNEFTKQNIVEVDKDTFARMAFGSRLKGILALARPEQRSLTDLALPKNPLIVVLEGVEKPGNLGAVIRSCDGAGVNAVINCDGKTDIYNHHVVRSSIGTLFFVPTVSAQKEDLCTFLQKRNIRILVATAKAEAVYTEIDFMQPTAVIIGNEHDGVSSFWMERADQLIKIPMAGESGCLNAAMSASILVYEACRQRKNT